MRREIVHIEGYFLVLSDEQINDVRPYEGQWHLEGGMTLNKFPNYLTDLSECKLVEWHLPLGGKPVLDGVALLPELHDEVCELAEEEAVEFVDIFEYNDKHGNTHRFNNSHEIQETYIKGYKKAREKYMFTEADMRRAINLAQDWKAIVKTRDSQYIEFKHTHTEIINSVRKQEKIEYPKYFDFVMYEIPCPDGIEGCLVYHCEIKTTSNALGCTVAVGSYNF